jgi:hypothetical protein
MSAVRMRKQFPKAIARERLLEQLRDKKIRNKKKALAAAEKALSEIRDLPNRDARRVYRRQRLKMHKQELNAKSQAVSAADLTRQSRAARAYRKAEARIKSEHIRVAKAGEMV